MSWFFHLPPLAGASESAVFFMYLKALKLHGFKSFADPSTLRFEPGVTAVVGPNGCGKSNIADAIRWVLGEQSAKALRGGRMQDVIFEGADTRKPAQLCEVSLLLTDCEKQLGSEFHEIEIMRRVHRDGGSDYFFNGQACRLKDIQKLFMDTGIGRTSYSIMAQGQIDQILSSKPEERRAVFEEAAGITKYKSQRREAMGKLVLTEQNLSRVSDVINEVGRQINSLRRQASKALRYKRISYRLRHLSLAYSAQNYARLAKQAGELQDKLEVLREAAKTRRSRLEEQIKTLDERKALRSRLNQRVQDAQQAVFDLRSQSEAANNAANMARIKRSGLLERLESSRANLEEVQMQARELAAQVDSEAQDKEQQLTLLGSSDDVFQQRNRELTVIDGELQKLEQELGQVKFRLLQSESTLARLRSECTGFEVDQKTSAQRHAGLEGDLGALRGQREGVQLQLNELEARVVEANRAKEAAQLGAKEAQERIVLLTSQFREAQKVLQEIDRTIAQRTARLKLLQQLQASWEGFGEGAKALLKGRLPDIAAEGSVHPLMEGLLVKSPDAKAIEALLGTAAQAVSVTDLATARTILAALEERQVGSAHLQIRPTGPVPLNTGHALPAGLRPATAGLDGFDAEHPAMPLLASCYLAEDLPGFLDFWAANPDFPFLLVATRKGDLVDQRGLIFGGYHKKPGNSIVQREIDLRDTTRELNEAQAQHDQQKTVIDGLNEALGQAETALEERRSEVLAASEEVTTVQTDQRNILRNLGEIDNRLERMSRELANLESARDEALARFQKAQEGLVRSETEASTNRERIHQLELRINEIRTGRDGKRESVAQARLELAERRQKVEVLDRGIADMRKRRIQLDELLVQRQQEIEVWGDQVVRLAHESDHQEGRARQLGETLVVAQEQVEKVRLELVQVEQEINAVEGDQLALHRSADHASTELNQCEVKLAEAASRAKFIAEDVQREFQEQVDRLDWKRLLWRSDEEPPDIKPLDLEDDADDEGGAAPATPEEAADGATKTRTRKARLTGPKPEPTEEELAALDATVWSDIKAEIDALRQRLAGMGAVNLVAIEEYADLKQRFDFLKAQSDDLINAKNELVAAIDEINATSQKQFSVTFEQIKKNFEHTFQTLFGGGVARLDLIEGEDVLESGIEITAQPPGTKLKGITLLSGGQKTLTAVALLFALYMVKPSPFCLLDELDAPLDESNIGRFTHLLKQFVSESQFIIITHNKRTVAAATAIYGVTMEERGVSKTVSMRFNPDADSPVPEGRTMADEVRGSRGTTTS